MKKYEWILAAVLLVGAGLVVLDARCNKEASVSWRRVLMDGSRTGVKSMTAEALDKSLGTFDAEGYLTPSGVRYADGPVAEAAALILDAQPSLSRLKTVVGHSAAMLMNLRTEPDLPLANLFCDALREKGSAYFRVPMDFALCNYGGIRVPLPEGAVTLEDIESMFPFNNYLVYAKVKGSNLERLLSQLAGTPAFQAISGARVVVKDHQLVSAEIGGKPIDPERVYHVTTLDFLLDGGDGISVGALAEDVRLTRVLMKDVMMEYVTRCEKEGKLLEGKKDGRVIME